jgi:hypothetical protein
MHSSSCCTRLLGRSVCLSSCYYRRNCRNRSISCCTKWGLKCRSFGRTGAAAAPKAATSVPAPPSRCRGLAPRGWRSTRCPGLRRVGGTRPRSGLRPQDRDTGLRFAAVGTTSLLTVGFMAVLAFAPVAGAQPGSSCDPNYSGACVPIASDVDCAGGSGNGPAYVSGPVTVVGNDIYGLDRDGNGTGCE